MKILISGTNGYLGHELKSYYEARGDSVIALSFRHTQTERLAFLNELAATLAREQPEMVINAGASQNGRDDVAALEQLVISNVLVPAAMMGLIKAHSPRTGFITFGTSWQIGEQGEESPFNAYAAAKAALGPFAEHFAQAGLRVATLRLYDTYGPGDTRRKIVNLIAEALLNDVILPMSPGEQMIDLVYIDDVITAVDATIETLRGPPMGEALTFAVRSGQPTTIVGLLELMKQVSGRSGSNIRLGAFPYRPRERFSLYPDTAAPPGWAPRVSLETGLRRIFSAREQDAAA